MIKMKIYAHSLVKHFDGRTIPTLETIRQNRQQILNLVELQNLIPIRTQIV